MKLVNYFLLGAVVLASCTPINGTEMTPGTQVSPALPPEWTPAHTTATTASPSLSPSTFGRITVQSVDRLKEEAVWEVGDIQGFAWAPDSSRIAVSDVDMASNSARLRLFTAPQGQEIWSVENRLAFGLAFDPSGEILAVPAPVESRIQLWDVGTGSLKRSIEDNRCSGGGFIQFSRNDEIITGYATGSLESTASIYVWDVRTGTCSGEIFSHRGWLNDLSFSADSRLVAASLGSIPGDQATRVFLLQYPAGVPICDGDAIGAVFSPDGSLIAVLEPDSLQVMMVDTSNCETVEELSASGSPFDIAPGWQLAAIRQGSKLQFWNLETDVLVRELDWYDAFTDMLAFSPDGKFLAGAIAGTATSSGSLTVWAVEATADQ